MEKHFVAVQASDGMGVESKQLSSKEDGLMACRSISFDVVDEDGKSIFAGNGEMVTRYLHFRASTHRLTVDGYKAVDDDGDTKMRIVFLSVFKEL
ncbi:MAG: hypothetical protein EOM68_24885 [Spirochaetia bacterium]|nr:hypothetical protein [Spirochaetia bacterium]